MNAFNFIAQRTKENKFIFSINSFQIHDVVKKHCPNLSVTFLTK